MAFDATGSSYLNFMDEALAILDQAFQVAREFKPLSSTEMAALVAKTKEPALTGKFEPFKTTNWFDGTAHNPQWLG